MKCDLIIQNAAQLVTCASDNKPKRGLQMRELSIIKNGALAVDKGKIIAVGDSRTVQSDFQSLDVIDAANKIVAPAFVDCHTHIVFAGNRLDEFELKLQGADYLEILANGGGILSTVEATRNATALELSEQSRKRLDAMLRNGTATAEVKTGYGLAEYAEIRMLDAIAEIDQTHAVDLIPTFLAAHAVPPEYKNNVDEYVKMVCEKWLPLAMNWFKDSHFPIETTPFFCDVFCEKNAFDLSQSRRILETAKNLGYKLKAHVDEFTNLGGTRMAIELGATSVDHLDEISADEIALLSKSDTIAVVTPTVNFNFGSSKFADARRLIDENCAVAVSTDYNPGSAPCPSLPMAMAIACRYQKLLPSEAFNAATINAAFAIGLGNVIGSLEVGKFADIAIFDADDYRQIAHEFGANFVSTVIKHGRTAF